MNEFVRLQGFRLEELESSPPALASEKESPYQAWLGVTWQLDAHQTRQALSGRRVDWLIVDHYGLDCRWEENLRDIAGRIMVIDDLADRSHDCDLLVDQNPGRHASHYTHLVPLRCRVLTDTLYALLRQEFSLFRDSSRCERQGIPNTILVSMGGVDLPNATEAALLGLARSRHSDVMSVNVVMTKKSPHLERVRVRLAQLPFIGRLHLDVQDMASLMMECDLAVGAAGTTSLERCCLGLPSIVVVLAANQRAGAQALKRLGAVLLATEGLPVEDEIARLLSTYRDEKNAHAMSQAAMRITDGKGCDRVVRIMHEPDC